MILLALLLSAPPPAVNQLLENGIRLVGKFAVAHACPVSETQAWTNAHVVDRAPLDQDVPLSPYAWSDGTGREGYIIPTKGVAEARDIALVNISVNSQTFGAWFKATKEPPSVGERLWLMGYDWANPRKAFSPEIVSVEVTRVMAGHVFFVATGKHKPKGGSSGSCLLNDSGGLVAVNEGGFETENAEFVGSAVGVWGSWGKFE